jgi:hypothetical protein
MGLFGWPLSCGLCGPEMGKGRMCLLPKAQTANAQTARRRDALLQPPVAATMPVAVAGAHELAGENAYILVRSQL